MLSFYDNSFVSALIDLYPSIGLKEENFHFSTSAYYNNLLIILFNNFVFNNFFLVGEFTHSKVKKKQFLLDFAKKHSFDPLDVTCWGKFTKEEFLQEKVHNFYFINKFFVSIINNYFL